MNRKNARPSNLALLAGMLFASVSAGSAWAQPLKVFILAGQSNMQGKGHVSTFDYIGMDPATAPMLKAMRDDDGNPVVLENVWISELGAGRPADQERHGRLDATFGSQHRGPMIGPEYTFGIYMEQFFSEPILLIKTAWGGRSLFKDFRPPSVPPEFGDEVSAAERQQIEAETGSDYRLMMSHIKKVLADPGRVCPVYDPAAGYEIAGFVWFQGWNDMVDRRMYPDDDYTLYSRLLAAFIRDVRRDLDAPEMPFVVGVIGVDGDRAAGHPFREAMAAPAGMPEFKGNVFNVHTANYWDDVLGELVDRSWRWQSDRYDPEGRYAKYRPAMQKLEERSKDQSLTRDERRQLARDRLNILYTPEEQEKHKGISNRPFHYLGAAKIYGQIGKAFAEAMAGALQANQTEDRHETIPEHP